MHEPVKTTLKAGTRIDRYGADGGPFTAPEGTPMEQRSLRLDGQGQPYSRFIVQQDVEVDGGITAPWFGQAGGGIQYAMPSSISSLLESGTLMRVP